MNDLFARRTSVRKFKPDALSQETIDRLLQAAIDAPSAGNKQPWHFYVVKNDQLREGLCAHAYNQRFISEAPVAIVVCADPARCAERYEQRGIELYCLQDTAAAIENILLCAVMNDLGGCWVGAFDEAGVSGVLNLPAAHRPIAILAIGHPLNPVGARRPRRPMEEVVSTLE